MGEEWGVYIENEAEEKPEVRLARGTAQIHRDGEPHVAQCYAWLLQQ